MTRIVSASRLWERLAGLELAVERLELRGQRVTVSSGFERLTTLFVLSGPDGTQGIGEDVTYDAEDHTKLQADPAWASPDGACARRLRGNFTLAEFAALVAELDLFPAPPVREVSRRYRRWALEAAALDLALRQSDSDLAEVLGREPRPLRFVVSLRLDEVDGRADPARVLRLLERYPGLRFKLDPTNAWDERVCAELAATGAVDVLDLKGHYRGTPVDVETDVRLYELVFESFPDAIVEDPDVGEATLPLLAKHAERISFDAPIHSVEDLATLPFPIRHLNIKPSRIGSLAGLLALYEHCEREGIAAYGGGQFELGPGRSQIQHLASLFHPDAPNDVAPTGYNEPDPPDGLPQSPLPAPRGVGFAPGGVCA